MPITQYNEPRQAEYISQFVPFPFEMAYKVLEDQQKKYDEGVATTADALNVKGKSIDYENSDMNNYIKDKYFKSIEGVVDKYNGDFRYVSNEIRGLKNQFETDPIVFNYQNRLKQRDESIKQINDSKMSSIDKQSASTANDILDIYSGKSFDKDGNLRNYNSIGVYDENKDYENLNSRIFQLEANGNTRLGLQEKTFENDEGSVNKILSTSEKTSGVDIERIKNTIYSYVDADSSVEDRLKKQATYEFVISNKRLPSQEELMTDVKNKKAILKENYLKMYAPQAYQRIDRSQSLSGGIGGDGTKEPNSGNPTSANFDFMLKDQSTIDKLQDVTTGDAYRAIVASSSEEPFVAFLGQYAKENGKTFDQSLTWQIKKFLPQLNLTTEDARRRAIPELMKIYNSKSSAYLSSAFGGNIQIADKVKDFASNYLYEQKVIDRTFTSAVERMQGVPNEQKIAVKKLYDLRYSSDFPFNGKMDEQFKQQLPGLIELYTRKNDKNKVNILKNVQKFLNTNGTDDQDGTFGYGAGKFNQALQQQIKDNSSLNSVKVTGFDKLPVAINDDGSIKWLDEKQMTKFRKSFSDNTDILLSQNIIINGKIQKMSDYISTLNTGEYENKTAGQKVKLLTSGLTPQYNGMSYNSKPLIQIASNISMILDDNGYQQIMGEAYQRNSIPAFEAISNINNAITQSPTGGIYKDMNAGIVVKSQVGATGYGKTENLPFVNGSMIQISVDLSKYSEKNETVKNETVKISNQANALRFSKGVEDAKYLYNIDKVQDPDGARKRYNNEIIRLAHQLKD